jgi:hypothetical protein
MNFYDKPPNYKTPKLQDSNFTDTTRRKFTPKFKTKKQLAA